MPYPKPWYLHSSWKFYLQKSFLFRGCQQVCEAQELLLRVNILLWGQKKLFRMEGQQSASEEFLMHINTQMLDA